MEKENKINIYARIDKDNQLTISLDLSGDHQVLSQAVCMLLQSDKRVRDIFFDSLYNATAKESPVKLLGKTETRPPIIKN